MFNWDHDMIICWCYGMATLNEWMVSDESKFFANPSTFKSVHEKVLNSVVVPGGANEQVCDTFHQETKKKGRFGFSTIFGSRKFIDIAELKYEHGMKLQIDELEGRYWGQVISNDAGKLIAHGVGRFLSDNGELLYDG